MPGYAVPQKITQQVIIEQRRRCNHPLHLVLTLVTCGAWLPVWLVMWIIQR